MVNEFSQCFTSIKHLVAHSKLSSPDVLQEIAGWGLGSGVRIHPERLPVTAKYHELDHLQRWQAQGPQQNDGQAYQLKMGLKITVNASSLEI